MVGGDKWYGDALPSPVLGSQGSVTGVSTRTGFSGKSVTAQKIPATQHPVRRPSPRCFSQRVVSFLRSFILNENSFQKVFAFSKAEECWQSERTNYSSLKEMRILNFDSYKYKRVAENVFSENFGVDFSLAKFRSWIIIHKYFLFRLVYFLFKVRFWISKKKLNIFLMYILEAKLFFSYVELSVCNIQFSCK